jgi:hypothetical protein
MRDGYQWRVKKFHLHRMNCRAEIKNNLSMIMIYADVHKWDCIAFYAASFHIILRRKNDKMNVYLSTMTIQTCMNHPSKGNTQLNRRNLSPEQMEQLFINPRVHTGKGYYHVKKGVKKQNGK